MGQAAWLWLNKGMSQDARVDEENAVSRRAQILNFQYLDTSQLLNKQLYPQFLTNAEMYSMRLIPLMADQSHITFGITNMTSQQTMQSLEQRFADYRIAFVLISDTGFKDYMKMYDPPKQIKYDNIEIKPHETESLQEHSISDTLNQVSANDMLAYLVKQAYRLNGSDIHIEAGKDSVRIRFRVDGVLHNIATLNHEKYRMLMSALASSANISTGAPDAQTGHINKDMVMADKTTVTVNVRVETVPTTYGHDAVLRLFTFRAKMLNLDLLGLSPYERQIVDDIITHPSGMVLFVGPTGSGKTTTLYSIVNQLNNPERKIITLEDPVEYNIEGITQVPVNSRQDEGGFASKLRAVLRLDPDVIMIGEIRDNDTAKTALQAALTGHLVLSTYHASSAAAAISRMIDAIGENPLFAASIRLITAQRLIRRLDDSTKQPYQADAQTAAYITRILSTLPSRIQKPDLTAITLYQPGKSVENPFGFKGQLAVRELLQMTPPIKEVLSRPAREVTTELIEQTATAGGMVTMMQDGILKALQGLTTLEEVYRAVG